MFGYAVMGRSLGRWLLNFFGWSLRFARQIGLGFDNRSAGTMAVEEVDQRTKTGDEADGLPQIDACHDRHFDLQEFQQEANERVLDNIEQEDVTGEQRSSTAIRTGTAGGTRWSRLDNSPYFRKGRHDVPSRW